MVRFRLFGIPVEIQPWFWITLALLGGALSASTPELLLDLLLFMLAGTISILVHELGHALTGKAFGAPTSITLQAFGGYASFPARSFTRVQSFLVTAAGPAIQILLGIGALMLLRSETLPTPAAESFVRSLRNVSFAWAILNLLPVIPLDGGQLVVAVLGPKRFTISLWISLVVAVIAALGLLLLTQGRSILFPIFMASFAFENWKLLQEIKRRGF
ncbi:hypothetical protein KBB96_20780 [Luteolibacter ambystomatis]|uniref:Peptidase M50 domain-containing protein n=1 Tax=Luteolibacter ambystomatis TaxID=2824561 RepID=A0A975G9E8_9BACT|nr:site-2 protease family protein [Luteolibacter ambystomatis]QUE51277.1 hypothetical protein KBB96_20780 [Luteolibacter ambystomatis]